MKRLDVFYHKLRMPPNNFYEWLSRLIGLIGFIFLLVYLLFKGCLIILSIFIYAALVLLDLPFTVITLGIYYFETSRYLKNFINDKLMFNF